MGERVVIKYFPLWESHDKILDFIKSMPQVEEVSKIYNSKSRDTNNRLTSYSNGDRYVFAKLTTEQALPERCTIEGYSCRIWYRYHYLQCKICLKYGHKSDSSSCLRQTDPTGQLHSCLKWTLSNFDPSPLTLGSTSLPTAEHAYQWRACIEYMREDLDE